MKISILQKFKQDHVTREAGEKLRHLILQRLETNQELELDFSETMIASTSFLDEGIAKLGLEAKEITQKISLLKIHHMHRRDQELLLDLCKKRKWESDPNSLFS